MTPLTLLAHPTVYDRCLFVVVPAILHRSRARSSRPERVYVHELVSHTRTLHSEPDEQACFDGLALHYLDRSWPYCALYLCTWPSALINNSACFRQLPIPSLGVGARHLWSEGLVLRLSNPNFRFDSMSLGSSLSRCSIVAIDCLDTSCRGTLTLSRGNLPSRRIAQWITLFICSVLCSTALGNSCTKLVRLIWQTIRI